MDTTLTSILHPISTPNSVCSSLDSDLSSDPDLDLFQLSIEKGTKRKAVDIHSEVDASNIMPRKRQRKEKE